MPRNQPAKNNPQSKLHVPKYRLHKSSGQAVVELNGRRFYCGKHGTAESWQRYHELVNQWIAEGRKPLITDAERYDATVAELLNAYRRHAEDYYAGNSGAIDGFKSVSRLVREHFGSLPVRKFQPHQMKTLQRAMIAKGWSRPYVNKQCSRVKAIFKWGTAEGMVPAEVFWGLQAIDGLRRGRTDAPEPEKVKPAPEQHIEAVKAHVSRKVAALIDLQLLTGARAGELVIMRPIDLDTTAAVWTYNPARHKGAHRDQDRTIYLGPRAQRVIEPFLSRPVEAYMFSPAEAEQERRAKIHEQRKTPLHRGNRPGKNRKRRRMKEPGKHYTTDSYRRAIYYGCADAGVPRWSPHQLRHNAGTRLRKEFGIETARVILGHRSPAVTDIYAELDSARAVEVIGKIG